MKKIRVMLAVIAVLAMAGGGMAFKAKRFGASSYCTTTLGGGDCCNSFLVAGSFFAGQGLKYVITTAPTLCTQRCPDCTSNGVKIN